MAQDKIAEIEQGRKIAEYADKLWGWGTPAGNLRAERRTELLVKHGKIEKHRRVLELGCGTGVFTFKLAPIGADITAIDISPDLLKKAKSKNYFNNVHFKVADAESMPFADNSFDVIVGCTILHHLDMVPAFKEITRVLRKEGRIVFCEPNMLNPQLMIQKNIPFIKKLMGDTPTETAFFKWKLKSFLRSRGFKDIFVEPFDFLHPWTPLRLVRVVKKLSIKMESIPIIRNIAGSLLIKATLNK